jgi:hypothetical protein
MEQKNILARGLRKLTKAIIIGVSCFFIGILLATLSPLITVLSLIYAPQKKPPLSDRLGKSLKNIEKKIKEAQDPDSREPWKQQHLDLYGTDHDGTTTAPDSPEN